MPHKRRPDRVAARAEQGARAGGRGIMVGMDQNGMVVVVEKSVVVDVVKDISMAVNSVCCFRELILDASDDLDKVPNAAICPSSYPPSQA